MFKSIAYCSLLLSFLVIFAISNIPEGYAEYSPPKNIDFETQQDTPDKKVEYININIQGYKINNEIISSRQIKLGDTATNQGSLFNKNLSPVATSSSNIPEGISIETKYFPGSPIYPLPEGSYRKTSPFGLRTLEHFYDGEEHFHNGLDLAAPIGTPVYAALDGIVGEVSYQLEGGNYVLLNHNNDITTLYAHLNETLVTEGAVVSKGQQIATVGNTGTMTSGPHLHFELRREGEFLDPELYLSGHVSDITDNAQQLIKTQDLNETKITPKTEKNIIHSLSGKDDFVVLEVSETILSELIIQTPNIENIEEITIKNTANHIIFTSTEIKNIESKSIYLVKGLYFVSVTTRGNLDWTLNFATQ